jgi:hypothetical protein
MTGPEEGLVALKELMVKKWPDLSETDTRSKIIDPLFKGCLGWTEDDISREEHEAGSFVDYIFRFQGIGYFVVEAKKKGVAFELPKYMSRRKYKISGTIATDTKLIAAIEQAQKYCVDKGVNFGIVTNGTQFVLFEAFRRNGSWREGKCMVFNGLDDIVEHFGLFWNVLARESILKGSLRLYVSEQHDILTFSRPLDSVHFKDAKLARNNLYQYLQPFARYFFGEITDESKIELLRDCYVYLKAHTDAEHSLRPYFLERIRQLHAGFGTKTFVESEMDAGQFRESLEDSERRFYEKTPEGKLFLLLGVIGAGKTTFLHRLFRVILEDREKLVWFYVDFRQAPVDPAEIETYIFKEVLEEFRNKYFQKMKEMAEESHLVDLQPNRKDLVMLFTLLRASGYSTVLMLDNVDQQWYASPVLQERIFLEAQNLSKVLRTIQILSLREETFFRSIRRGTFDAYYVEKYDIPPPDFENMIQKRLDFAIALLQSPSKHITEVVGVEPPPPKEVKEMVAFLKIVRDSIVRVGPTRKAITSFINAISRGDMRQALRFFNSFLASGNTKVDEMVSKYQEKGVYIIPYHAFLKSVILGESKYYSGNTSEVINLLDMNTEYTSSHFITLRILKYAKDRMQVASAARRGMIDIDLLKQEAGKVGIPIKAIDDSLQRLADAHLIELEGGASNPNESGHFAITPTGEYYVGTLVNRFVYLDLIWQDTPISDESLTKMLHQVINSTNLELRLERVTQFIDYLKGQEEMEFANSPEYADSSFTSFRFAESIAKEFKREKEWILKRQEEIYGP